MKLWKKKKMDKNLDFEAFKEDVSWFLKPNSDIVFKNSELRISEEFKATFPKLNGLIQKARVTNIDIDSQAYILFAWDSIDNQICGWLNKIEEADSYKCEIIEEHELLLRTIGGIKESFNEPEDSFTNNQNFLFIGSECMRGIGDWDDYYSMMCEDDNCEKIAPSNYLAFVYEANGALTMYEPETRKVFLFSHDHCFDNVDFIENQPEYTFHRFKNVSTFTDYVEELADQWNNFIQ
ncbi:hypothetical protein [uncultured Draconibacterium sp.]|uniref:hypothetical protein n=1 Tax=uncultured Draconibacterium sp. TaxID=1573823 RepID=UPI0029C9A3CA|nr:hypothetical protein [uncultured Draconibacterium sp.]